MTQLLVPCLLEARALLLLTLGRAALAGQPLQQHGWSGGLRAPQWHVSLVRQLPPALGDNR